MLFKLRNFEIDVENNIEATDKIKEQQEKIKKLYPFDLQMHMKQIDPEMNIMIMYQTLVHYNKGNVKDLFQTTTDNIVFKTTRRNVQAMLVALQ